jgi:hypothetical protein
VLYQAMCARRFRRRVSPYPPPRRADSGFVAPYATGEGSLMIVDTNPGVKEVSVHDLGVALFGEEPPGQPCREMWTT